jgi:hypothetical protein
MTALQRPESLRSGADPIGPTHRHGSSCYWDHRRCRWCCSTTLAPAGDGRLHVHLHADDGC